MEYFKDFKDVCLSGGTDGADIEWGNCAASLGHIVIHWSFLGHKSQASKHELVRLTDEQLDLIPQAVEKAALALGKSSPRKRYVASLIRRNYYQVARSDSCYAVTVIRDDAVPGGTAWATTMFAQLHPENNNLWLFDQGNDAWLQWNGKTWDHIESPPQSEGVWAGIGSCGLKQNGRDAVRRLMQCQIEEHD